MPAGGQLRVGPHVIVLRPVRHVHRVQHVLEPVRLHAKCIQLRLEVRPLGGNLGGVDSCDELEHLLLDLAPAAGLIGVRPRVSLVEPGKPPRRGQLVSDRVQLRGHPIELRQQLFCLG